MVTREFSGYLRLPLPPIPEITITFPEPSFRLEKMSFIFLMMVGRFMK